MSGLLVGPVVDRAGDSTAFLVLGAVALLGLVVLVAVMPETGPAPSAATARA